jgi:hypothetical protein
MAPVAGFVGFAVPEVQGVPDTFCPECIAEGLVVFKKNIFFSYDKNDFQRLESGDPIRVMEVGDELAGGVVIDIFIPVAIEEIAEMFERDGKVITAAEAHDFVKEIWIFEGEIDGMPCAEAATGCHDCGVRVFFLYAGEYLFGDIFFKLQVAEYPFAGVEVLCVKAILVYAVQAPDLDAACLDLAAKGFDDPPVLIVEKMSGAGGEEQYRISGVTEDQQLHIPLQVGAEPFMIFPVHCVGVARYCRMISFHKA